MDIGGNTENMMRYLPTNVLVGNYEYQAPDLYTAEEHMTWTKEALERMDRIPGFVVGMATGAILRYAIEKGYTVITAGVIDEVIMSILRRERWSRCAPLATRCARPKRWAKTSP